MQVDPEAESAKLKEISKPANPLDENKTSDPDWYKVYSSPDKKKELETLEKVAGIVEEAVEMEKADEPYEEVKGDDKEPFEVKHTQEDPQTLPNFLESSFYSQYDFLNPTEKFTYGVWNTSKPKVEGYSHELISPDARNLLYNTDLETMEGLPFDGVDTLLKAFKRNVIRNPDHEYFGTKV